jgi:hypothetical protein
VVCWVAASCRLLPAMGRAPVAAAAALLLMILLLLLILLMLWRITDYDPSRHAPVGLIVNPNPNPNPHPHPHPHPHPSPSPPPDTNPNPNRHLDWAGTSPRLRATRHAAATGFASGARCGARRAPITAARAASAPRASTTIAACLAVTWADAIRRASPRTSTPHPIPNPIPNPHPIPIPNPNPHPDPQPNPNPNPG